MQVVANYEIKAECSVVADDLRVQIKHPQGLYRALIKNIPRSDYSTPFLLSLHLYFDTPDLDGAKEIAEERLAECLNMLAFASGAAFSRHRIRQIVDCTPDSGMRDIRFWGDAIDHEDPQPFLDQRALTMLYWVSHISSSTDAVKNFLIDKALDQYDEAVAMQMGELVEGLAVQAAQEAQRAGIDLTNGETRDVATAMKIVGTFEDKFYEAMREIMQRRRDQS